MTNSDRAQRLMDIHFPNVSPVFIWDRDTSKRGRTIPRTLPIAMQAIDMQSKGQPAGHTLFCLWARSPNHPLLVIENPAVFAGEAGFLGARAVDTWRKRMKRLRDLSFIASKPGPSGEFHYVFLLNPNAILEWMRLSKKLSDEIYGRFLDRLAELGPLDEIDDTATAWNAAITE